jgi:hypothetical protein
MSFLCRRNGDWFARAKTVHPFGATFAHVDRQDGEEVCEAGTRFCACYWFYRGHTRWMKISDIDCKCGASYRRAESTSEHDIAGQFNCRLCGMMIEKWENQVNRRAYRLIVAPENAYSCPAAPPSP